MRIKRILETIRNYSEIPNVWKWKWNEKDQIMDINIYIEK